MLSILAKNRPKNNSHEKLNRLAKVYAKESQHKGCKNLTAAPFSF
jgi:hypothetical protein